MSNKKEVSTSGKVVLHCTKDEIPAERDWWFTTVARNKQAITTSQTYVSRQGALRGIRSLWAITGRGFKDYVDATGPEKVLKALK